MRDKEGTKGEIRQLWYADGTVRKTTDGFGKVFSSLSLKNKAKRVKTIGFT